MQTFAHHALRKITRKKDYAPDWLDLKLEDKLAKKTEGLFVWIASMARFLLTTSRRDKKLRTLMFGK